VQQAYLDIRVLPWRARRRNISADDVREAVVQMNPLDGADDLGGLVLGLAVWIAVFVAAPVVAIVVVVLLFSVELPLVIALAALIVVLRFTGVIPWTVLVVDRVTGAESRERFRFLPSALRRIREVGTSQRIEVRWSWV
jgi:hypothetical protein